MKVRYLQSANRELLWFGAALTAALLTLAPKVRGQQGQAENLLALPDAPQVAMVEQPTTPANTPFAHAPFAGRMDGSIFSASDPSVPASKHQKYILPGQVAPQLSPGNKIAVGVRDVFTPFTLVGIVFAGAYGHLTNGSPNYGVNSEAFAQRVGAAAARGVSEGLFTDCVASIIFHEDTRYYEMGPNKPLLKRLLYATTRVIITRTDSGRATPNLALLTGYAGGVALTNLYYPQLNRGFRENAITYGGSLGGEALGNAVDEFSGQILQWLHLKKAR